MRIWVDADSCPAAVRKIVIRASRRLGVAVCFVANVRVEAPPSDLIKVIQVERTEEATDEYICRFAAKDDMVITADVPLASRLVPVGVVVINPRGDIFTRESIKERLSMRNFSAHLREMGIDTRDPINRGKSSVKKFAEIFDRELTRAVRDRS
jgi:uncharacterized protein YaiI (UPF0178 family)